MATRRVKFTVLDVPDCARGQHIFKNAIYKQIELILTQHVNVNR